MQNTSMAGFTTTRQRPANARQPNRWVPSPHGGDLLVVARCRWLTRKGCRRCSVHRFGGYPVRKQHKIVKFDTNKLDGLSRLNFPAVGSRNSRRPAPASFDTAKACVGCTIDWAPPGSGWSGWHHSTWCWCFFFLRLCKFLCSRG